MLEIKNAVFEMKTAFDGRVSRLTWLRKKSVRLNISKQQLLKLKCKEENEENEKHRIEQNRTQQNRTEYLRTVEQDQKLQHAYNWSIRNKRIREQSRWNICRNNS